VVISSGTQFTTVGMMGAVVQELRAGIRTHITVSVVLADYEVAATYDLIIERLPFVVSATPLNPKTLNLKTLNSKNPKILKR
jgi:hypothetical protein